MPPILTAVAALLTSGPGRRRAGWPATGTRWRPPGTFGTSRAAIYRKIREYGAGPAGIW